MRSSNPQHPPSTDITQPGEPESQPSQSAQPETEDAKIEPKAHWTNMQGKQMNTLDSIFRRRRSWKRDASSMRRACIGRKEDADGDGARKINAASLVLLFLHFSGHQNDFSLQLAFSSSSNVMTILASWIFSDIQIITCKQ